MLHAHLGLLGALLHIIPHKEGRGDGFLPRCRAHWVGYHSWGKDTSQVSCGQLNALSRSDMSHLQPVTVRSKLQGHTWPQRNRRQSPYHVPTKRGTQIWANIYVNKQHNIYEHTHTCIHCQSVGFTQTSQIFGSVQNAISVLDIFYLLRKKNNKIGSIFVFSVRNFGRKTNSLLFVPEIMMKMEFTCQYPITFDQIWKDFIHNLTKKIFCHFVVSL